MEVRNHGVHYLKAIARGDKQACMAPVWLNLPIVHTGDAFQHTYRGGTDGENAPTSMACLANQRGGGRVQLDLFAVHLMLADHFALNRPERIETDV